ncbi:MAG: DUF1343 domain-containing protein [Thermodesulfovibrionales bacterium]|nr:DUF1343 domain-containing protein [Thermodesulfovibrionales bacterium]
MSVLTGLDLIARKLPTKFKGLNAGLLVHPASINKKFQHAIEVFFKFTEVKIKALFGPQHGIFGHTQDNMVEWQGFIDSKRGIPVYSLYSDVRKPLPEMLKDIEVLFIDLQDIGARYYTFIWTVDLCMQACYENNKAIVVLDRPNPINGVTIEGTVLDESFSSFVGLKPLPIRHAMTIGEIGNYIKNVYYKGLNYHVVKMDGWRRQMWFDNTDLPWVMPSPNMPTIDTAIVYPGMCLLEGTLLSEGRGTTRPFEIFGAPFIEPDILIKKLKEFNLEGVHFRPLWFQPTFQKYAGVLCGGAQIHVLDRQEFKPFKTAIAIIKAVHDLYPNHSLWRQPPYEYETIKMPFDILCGTDRIRKSIEAGDSLDNIEQWWLEQSFEFDKNVRKKFLLYD